MAHEIGTLRALPNGESVFVGSSSGVFFINTVRRAFLRAVTQHNHVTDENASTPLTSLPSPEECIYDSDSHFDTARPLIDGLGELPDRHTAKELLMAYFRTWHPLVPFLHGPTCLAELESLYSDRINVTAQSRKPRLALTVIFQCLFNIAKLDRPDLPSLGWASFRTEEQLLTIMSSLSLKCDIESIQALLTAQLYFVAAMHLQAASSAGGIVLRSIYKSGLHRCPTRYSTFSPEQRDMRKRVFWSAYTLDRFTSQSLGHPLGVQDSDIDVCQPGMTELHEPVSSRNSSQVGTSPEDIILHLPVNHPQRTSKLAQVATKDTTRTEVQDDPIASEQDDECSNEDLSFSNPENSSASQQRRENQSAQTQSVRYSRLIGRVLETFHKSIHSRSTGIREVLLLKAEIDAWGNSLPYSSLDHQPSHPCSISSPAFGGLNQGVFFEVARQHLILLVNRPSLSLKPTSPEFRHSIQVCIGASRSIIRSLQTHLNTGGLLFWPGYLSAVWMGGLIMVFACQSKSYSIANATSEIMASLRILEAMTPRWSMAKNCHEVLSWLLETIKKSKVVQASQNATEERFKRENLPQCQITPRGRKRPREEQQVHSFMGSTHRHKRVSNQNSPSQSTIPACDNRVQSLESESAGFENFEVNYQGINSATDIDPRLISTRQNSDFDSRLPASFTSQDSIPEPQQSVPRVGPPSVDAHEWDETWQSGSTIDFVPNYDIFDGAMWGSLLEMVDPNV